MAKMTIKANRDYITLILDKVINGEYAIPEFQRDFVWSNRAIVEFFDSIIKGYPIGSLILWRPEAEEFKTLEEIGGVRISCVENKPEGMYVLDGRQRLTALASVLLPDGQYYSNVYIDLDDMQIIYVRTPKTRTKASLLKLGVAYDTYELVDFLEKLKNSPLTESRKKEYAEKAKTVNKTLLSYELGYIAVHGGYIDDAVEIFSRLNSKSTPISADYMLQALAYSPHSDFLFAKEISAIQLGLKKYNFQHLKRETVLKCVYTYADIPFIDGKVEKLLKIKSQLPAIMAQVAEDITKAVQFLFHQCGVIDYRLLPYTYQLVMLASFFRWNKNPSPLQVKALKKWFFYTTYCSYFTNTSLSVVREDIKRFTDYSQGHAPVPIEYGDDIDFKYPNSLTLNNVRACAFIITTILRYKLQKENARLEIITLPHSSSKEIGNSFICTNTSDVKTLLTWLEDKAWAEKMNKFGLNEELSRLYADGEDEDFIAMRSAYLIEEEKAFIKKILKSQS